MNIACKTEMTLIKFQHTTLGIFLFQHFLRSSSAWTTTITLFDTGRYWAYLAPVAYCTAVPPGYCCQPTTIFTGSTRARFIDLPPGAIAAVWQYDGDREDQRGCNTRVLQAHAGQPNWMYYARTLNEISGGSYIQCPAGNLNRGWVQVLAGFCMKLLKRSGRELLEEDAVIQPTWGYPDIITVEGINYTDHKRNDLMYRDPAGNELNLTYLA
ncbi:hypothetical protein MMC14_000619 [Varicellaria rhodocarpa]|nr:hypothetical protein [Varicellaria rhodocarpa]